MKHVLPSSLFVCLFWVFVLVVSDSLFAEAKKEESEIARAKQTKMVASGLGELMREAKPPARYETYRPNFLVAVVLPKWKKKKGASTGR